MNHSSDKTAIEILREFAKRSGRNVEFSEKPYPSTPMHPVIYHRRTLFIPNNIDKTSYFLCFGDSKEFGKHATYSGVFIPVSLPSSTTIMVRKRDVLDKWNPFKKHQTYKTGSRNFDSRVVISGNDPLRIKRIFNNSRIQDIIIKAFNLDEGLIIAINEVDAEFVPGLKNKSNFGIFSIQEWLLDSSLIEELFDLVEELKMMPVFSSFEM